MTSTAGLGGLLDGLEHRKVVERVGLAADGKAADPAFLGDFVLGADRARRQRGDNGAEERGKEMVLSAWEF